MGKGNGGLGIVAAVGIGSRYGAKTPEEIFAEVSKDIERQNQILKQPVFQTTSVQQAIVEFKKIEQRIINQPGDTKARQDTKAKIEWQLNRVRAYADMLQIEIDKMKKRDKVVDTKEDQSRNVVIIEKSKPKQFFQKIDSNVASTIIAPYFSAKDKAKMSRVCKFWRDHCYKSKILENIMPVSENVVIRIADFIPLPTWGEFNRARKAAMNDSSFFFKNNPVASIPKHLTAIINTRDVISKSNATEVTDQKKTMEKPK